MKKTTYSALSLTFAVSYASAVIIASEDFDYTSGTTLGTTQTGGTGWATSGSVGYYRENLSTQPSQMEAFDYAWTSSYTGYTPLSTSKTLRNNSGAGALTGARFLENSINMDTGEDLYFSFLVRPDDNATRGTDGTNYWTNFVLRDGTSSTSNGRDTSALVQITGSGDFKVAGGNGAGGEFGTSTGSAATEGTEYLVVGLIEFGSGVGGDTMSASIFSSGSDVSSEPVSWTISTSTTLQGDIDNVALRINGESQLASLRLGDSYASVVPEPSSYALMAGSLALGWIMVRRRS